MHGASLQTTAATIWASTAISHQTTSDTSFSRGACRWRRPQAGLTDYEDLSRADVIILRSEVAAIFHDSMM